MPGVSDHPTPKARILGAELRELRKEGNLNVRQLGARLGVGQATVSRYERGERTPPVDYVARVLGTLGVAGDKYNELVEFARSAGEPNLITGGSAGRHSRLIELAEFERAAVRVVYVAALIVPGPFQTRRYAREVMSSLPSEERDVRVELRMARREVLEPPRQIDVLMTENALRTPLGGSDVLAEQVDDLISRAAQSNITIRLLPASHTGWTIAHDGPFVVYEFAKNTYDVHLDHYRGPAFLHDVKDVQAYRDALHTLREAVMSPEDSLELMKDVRKQL